MPTLGCRWAVWAKIRTYAAPTELGRAFGAVVAINMALLTELPWMGGGRRWPLISAA